MIMQQFSEKFLVIASFCRYCVAGTIGHKLMSGKATTIDLDKDTRIDVRCQVNFLVLRSILFNLVFIVLPFMPGDGYFRVESENFSRLYASIG